MQKAARIVRTNVEDRAALLERRRSALDTMWALRDKAIPEDMELWNEERLQREMAALRGDRTAES